MTKSRMQLTSETATDFWNDSCSLNELREAVENGAVGATSNPVIVYNVIKNEEDFWMGELRNIIKSNPHASEEAITWKLIEHIGIEAAKILQPTFENSNGQKGRLSLQVNPAHYNDAKAMVADAKHLASLAPNIAIKAPCTAEGIAAMEEMTANGIVINGTVCFTLPQMLACAEAVERGLKRAEANGLDTSSMQPNVTLMVGRLDDYLRDVMSRESIILDPGYLEWAGVAVFKKAYKIFNERGYRSVPLAAAYRNHMHWSEFIGGRVVLTVPYKWWKKFNNSDIDVTPRIDNPVEQCKIDALYKYFNDFRKAFDEDGMQTDEFITYGATVKTLNQFVNGYYDLLNFIRNKRLVVA
ncbi:transaldolase family protein [Lentisphaerota bacterium ZTH]|nr:transaldolase family protein [Lentisphaerota bacterium]WET07536.1 transaldolase family protein [Lentisphaerota bacterium ZTH]